MVSDLFTDTIKFDSHNTCLGAQREGLMALPKVPELPRVRAGSEVKTQLSSRLILSIMTSPIVLSS